MVMTQSWLGFSGTRGADRGARRLQPASLLHRLLRGLLLSLALLLGGGAQAAEPADPVRVVYHFDSGLEQASRALRNIRNHLIADPHARIEVVALASGIDFMIEGAKDAGGYPYDLVIQQLSEQGVRFKACANTLETRHLKAGDLAEGIIVVPSGVAELARLQYREHFAYIKP